MAIFQPYCNFLARGDRYNHELCGDDTDDTDDSPLFGSFSSYSPQYRKQHSTNSPLSQSISSEAAPEVVDLNVSSSSSKANKLTVDKPAGDVNKLYALLRSFNVSIWHFHI
jgi:hypothetical protein